MIRRFPGALLALALLAVVLSAAAADHVRVFQLRHRPASEVKALVEPLVPDSVHLSATGFQLLARGPDAELQHLQALIDRLDASAPSLVIETRRGSSQIGASSGGSVSGRAGPGGADLHANVYSTERSDQGLATQSARGIAGQPVYISRSLEVPVRDRDVSIGEDRTGVREQTSHYRRLANGFYATATVSGDRVRVEISAAADTLDSGAHGTDAADTATRRRLLTTVTGKLGEWMLIGNSQASANNSEGGITYRTDDRRHRGEQLWLRVRRVEEKDG